MTDSRVNVVTAGVARVNHETVDEFHALGTLSSQFSGHNNFATLGTRLHDETQHTIASPENNEPSTKNYRRYK